MLSAVGSTNVTWSYEDPNDPGKGLLRVSANGEACHGDGPRITTLHLPCDPSVSPQHAVLLVLNDMNPSCSYPGYEFTLASSCACAGGCSAGNLSRFVIFTLFLVSAYLAFGCILNNLRFKKTGWEAIPHLEFWQYCGVKVQSAYTYAASRLREKITGATYIDVKPARSKSTEEAGLLHSEPFVTDEFEENL